MAKKLKPVKKDPEVVREVQWKLDSAIVRGESKEVIERLRMELVLAKQSVRKI